MELIIRKLKDGEHNYFAYLHAVSGKGTYMLYFEDNIYGAVCLYNFITARYRVLFLVHANSMNLEMLKAGLKIEKAEIRIQDREIENKSEAVLDVIKQERSKNAGSGNNGNINKI